MRETDRPFPPFAHSSRFKTLAALADQMDRSARSVKQNIVEGWKRNSTKEYYEFLGFSLGANAELEEDCNDIIKGVYAEMGLKGMEKGDGKEEKGERGTPSTPSPHFPLFTLDEVERFFLSFPFPPLVRLKLRCKELNMLLQKLQSSLADKMSSEHRTPLVDRQNAALKRERENDAWIEREREKWEKGGNRSGILRDMTKIAINGFGRIGRGFVRACLSGARSQGSHGREGFEIVAINDLAPADNLAYLLKYDTVYGRAPFSVETGAGALIIDGKKVPVLAEKDPASLPWRDMGIDIVIESTGFFTSGEKAKAHLDAGAKRVVISALKTKARAWKR